MIEVRAAVPDDLTNLVDLLEEMDRFYGAAKVDPHHVRLDQVNEALFGRPPAAHALVAQDEHDLVGFAAYSFLWPAVGLTRSLYLKELYVAEAARNKGVGSFLMRQLARVALDTGCSRVEWTTDQDNELAQKFYETLGVKVNGGKLFYRAEEAAQIGELARTPHQ